MGITKPSKVIFWISLVIGLYALIDQFVTKLGIPILSDVSDIVLLAIAYVLLLAGVVIKKL